MVTIRAIEADPRTAAGGSAARDRRPCILIVCPVEGDLKDLVGLVASWHVGQVHGSTESPAVDGLCAELQPDLVVLDLGRSEPEVPEVLERMSAWNAGRTPCPVLVFADARRAETRREAFEAGASEVLPKLVDAEEVRIRVGQLLDNRRMQEDLRRHGELVEQRVRERARELDRARLEALQRLSMVGESRDDVSREHPARVGRCVRQLGAELGYPEQMVAVLAHAATLHDIGNIAVPDAILLKRGRLTPDEEAVMRTHVDHGMELLAGSESPLLQAAHEIVASHHEWWNGAGYPGGLQGAEIPLAGRLVAVADVFDALMHQRPHRPALQIADAVLKIVESSGAHFDPDVVEAFLTLDHQALLAPLASRSTHDTVRSIVTSAARPAFSPDPPAVPPLRTIGLADAAAALGVSPSTVRRWADSGRVPSQRTAGGHRRFAVNEIRAANRSGATGGRPTVKPIAPPTGPLPAVARSLTADGSLVVELTGRLLYDGLPGWWTTDAALEFSHEWVAWLATSTRSGRYEPAIRATRELMARAEMAGTSRLERHQFLERFGDILIRRLTGDQLVRHAEIVSLRRLFAALRQTVLDDGPARPSRQEPLPYAPAA